MGRAILYPDLNGIVEVLNANELRTGISTNGSKKTSFTTSTRNFDHMTFSVPGWSQFSYDKIHGLRFDRIKANIEATMENMRATGFEAQFHLSYHVYQFNAFEELYEAQQWCGDRGILFQPYYAYVNDYQPAKDFRKGLLPRETIDDFSRKLFLHYVDDLVKAQPEKWPCPPWEDRLTLTHKGEVLLCCVVPDSHPAAKLGSIFDLTKDELFTRKTYSNECGDCLDCGIAYWAHNAQHVPMPEPKVREEIAPVVQKRPVIDFFRRIGARQ